MKNYFSKISVLALLMISLSCSENPPAVSDGQSEEETEMHKLVSNYAVVDLTADLSGLSANRKLLIKKLIEASDVMEDLFWKDAIGDKTEFLSHYSDPDTLAYLQINYGPWDRLNGDKDFIGTFGEKSPGANYYPHDITAEEFAAFPDMNKNSWYTLLRRDEHGALKCVWYHEAYADEIERAAVLLEEAAQLAEDEGFKN